MTLESRGLGQTPTRVPITPGRQPGRQPDAGGRQAGRHKPEKCYTGRHGRHSPEIYLNRETDPHHLSSSVFIGSLGNPGGKFRALGLTARIFDIRDGRREN